MTTEVQEITPIPEAVAAAINAVMGKIKTLSKDDSNKFGKYDFVSTDKFLAAVNPLCAEAGLIILQDEETYSVETREMEDDYGKVKTKSYLTLRFSFILAHKTGASWGPLHRTIMVPANGAQAFGSAQSYALKQFLRSLFQISTGDKDDADLQPDDPLPAQTRKQAPPKAPPKPAGDLVDETTSASIRAAIDLCGTKAEIIELMTKHKEILDRLVDGEALRESGRTKISKLKETVA